MVLVSKNNLTKLIFEYEHEILMHAGPQLLLANIREKIWPINGRNLARKIARNCLTCFKTNPREAKAIMGNLPCFRVNPAPTFYHTGVDFAGPYKIKDRKGRGCKVTKAYVCVYVCMVTKAVHLELVSDCTKDAFLACLRRFISRWGKPAEIFSDNGTNFVGANNELKELGDFLKNEASDLEILIDDLDIKWKFIPAYSPHQGGLWEAGVKSMKFHLKRVLWNTNVTFEELYTLLTQVESLLNSRPLTSISNDPNDLNPLTPAHFLIGRKLTAAADPSLLHIKEGRLSNWQKIQSLQQQIWGRWRKEYIAELQKRVKWKAPFPSIELGELVIIKDDNLPPAFWKLGRINELHTGNDNVTRVTSVRTANGVVRRAFTKICPLPKDDNSIQDT